MRLFGQARAFAASLGLAAAEVAPGQGAAGQNGTTAGAVLAPNPDPMMARLRLREGEWLEEEGKDLQAAATAYVEVGVP